ncbi:nuclear pore complex protein NUP58-like isoform X2 [Panicum hallii]|uniref:nuclear pore complex protein NUP58-like isoform X2 n=1 Tax=Panicum hallii TaxID=206008 RepID=UPI000DF4DBCF|nr:nuclear pore complex protein NUP58-like isoform X2 [Panicum hallii]
MPGLDWDLNLDPDLQAAARRLSFSDADFPSSRRGLSDMKVPRLDPRIHATSPRKNRLPTINEKSSDELAMAQAPALEQCTWPPSSLGTAGWLYQERGETLTPTGGAPVATLLPLALPGSSQSQQLLEAGAAARTLEQLRQEESLASFGEHQQRCQQASAMEAGLQQAWAAAAAAALPQSQVRMLYTVDGGAAGYETKWDELHPVCQGLLLQIEENIREYRDDSERLDQCSHFDDLSPFNFEFDAGQIIQEAVSISTIMNREKISIESLMTVIKEIMCNTDFAIRSYVKLRPRFVRLSTGIANHSGSSDAQTDFSQLLTMAPSFHHCSSATRRPSPFVQQTVARFEDHLGECCKWILELEQLVQIKNDKTFAESLESLSKVMSNIHDYLIHVASKVEHIHQSAETMKTQYLKDQQCRGDLSNPFHKANRREEAKQQATAGIIHPMLHLSPLGQPTTLVAVPMISSQLQQTSFPIVATSPSSYPALPLPSVLPSFSMQTSPAPSTNPFSSSGSVLQSTPFGSLSTLELGSMPVSSLFRTGIPSSATSLFSIPYGDNYNPGSLICSYRWNGSFRHQSYTFCWKEATQKKPLAVHFIFSCMSI